MIDSLAAALTAAAALLAVVVLVAALADRYRWRRTVPALIGTQAMLLLQAVIVVVGLVEGRQPAERVTFLAYLGVSVIVLPATVLQVRGDDDRWSGVVVAVAFVVVAVVQVRAAATWR